MGLLDRIKSMSLKMKIISSVAVIAIIVSVIFFIISRNGYLATTMRLLRVEGTVNIEDARGGSKPVASNMRFQSGDSLSTGSDGLASVGLDDTKTVTLQNDSRAEFQKRGKRLELKLTKGAVFFNVTEKLKADETFEIKTSTMTAGIRGTSGMIYFDNADGGRESIVVTDGVVEISATNPVTGETKTARIEGGNKIKVYLYSDRSEDSVEFKLAKVSEKDLDAFALRNIAENDELINRVSAYTGWDKDKLKKALKDLDYDKDQGPSETPTPVPAEETTEEVQTPTPTPVTSPTDTAVPTIEPPPTTEPTKAPTNTPVPTRRPSNTSTPTSSPASTPENTPTSTPTPTNTNTPTPTPTDTPVTTVIPGPSVPSGYERTTIWDVDYQGGKAYICKLSDSGSAEDYGKGTPTYRGYYNGDWYDLTYERDSGVYYATVCKDIIIYCEGTLTSWNGEPTWELGDYQQHVWDATYNGQTVKIALVNGVYYGDWKGNFRTLVRTRSGSNYTYRISGSTHVYYVGDK